jgi:hypothetical protein
VNSNNGVESRMAYCGIRCGDCGLGSGEFAATAGKTAEFIEHYRLAEWSGFVPGGADLDVPAIKKGLDWIASSVGCPGCQNGGGPPQCTIRNCAKSLGYESCAACDLLDACGKFDWLGEKVPELKRNLRA